MTDVATVRLYGHALTLAFWAFVVWVLQLAATPGAVVLILASLAAASFAAERERARRRREPR